MPSALSGEDVLVGQEVLAAQVWRWQLCAPWVRTPSSMLWARSGSPEESRAGKELDLNPLKALLQGLTPSS